MTAVEISEISEGLVTYLDPAKLSEHSDCLTNARVEAVAKGKRPFIVLGKDEKLGGFLCVPLFSNHEVPDLLPVDETAKGGWSSGWVGKPSFYHPCQFWIIPAARFPSASLGVEYCDIGQRKTFGRANPLALTKIAEDRDKSDQPFRHVPISN